MRTLLITVVALAGLPGGAVFSAAQEKTMAPMAVFADPRENNLSAEEMQGVQSLSSMRVVNLQSFSGSDRQKLEEILRDTEDGFGEVRAAIEENQTIEAALRDRDVPLSRVIAVTRSETGALTINTGEPVL